LVDVWVGMIDVTFCFAVAQGTLLRYPIDFKSQNRTRIDTTFILCTGVPQWFEISPSNCAYYSGDNPAVSCKDLVNLDSVIPEITWLICVPLYLYWAKIGLPTFISLRLRVHSGTSWTIARPIGALIATMIRLHLVQIWWVSVQ